MLSNRALSFSIGKYKGRWTHIISILALFLAIFFAGVHSAYASRLILSPERGTFSVGDTFDVSILLNSEGKEVNALDVSLVFPPELLQLVSPTAGRSIVEIWTTQPTFNNQTGRVRLQGVIPGGIRTDQGLVTRLTFRVRSVGEARVRFLDDSVVLLHDGHGTPDHLNFLNGSYTLSLPPPEGPTIRARPHEDQDRWYRSRDVLFEWDGGPGVDGYSYVLNNEPVAFPDNISQGTQTSVTYKDLSDGIHYFHIKALRGGQFGGVTHYSVKIDTTPPAQFPIDVIPSNRTTSRQPVVRFETTDVHSGIDRYELKLVPRSTDVEASFEEGVFVEAQSPHILPPLEPGTYDVIVRAYDQAGNYQESSETIRIVPPGLGVLSSDGVQMRGTLVPWVWILWPLFIVLLILSLIAWWIRRLHHKLEEVREERVPEDISSKLEELQQYRKRYGKITGLILAVFFSGLLPIGSVQGVEPEHENRVERIAPTPPLIASIPRRIAEEDIFYVSGKTSIPRAEVVIYLQNTNTGEMISRTITSGDHGEWFYRHDALLPLGRYILWAQTRSFDEFSPPSPQVELIVERSAIRFGSSRVSYEVFYGVVASVLLILLLIVVTYLMIYASAVKRKRKAQFKEIQEAEEAVREGFALLRKDIQAELEIIKKARFSKELSAEEQRREETLLRDLDEIERRIEKEVWDIEKVGSRGG